VLILPACQARQIGEGRVDWAFKMGGAASVAQQATTAGIDADDEGRFKRDLATYRRRSSGPLGQSKQHHIMFSYQLLEVAGVGGFGKVWKARHLKTGQIYAIKAQAMDRASNALSERDVLLKLTGSPFIIELQNTFDDREFIYLVLEFVSGGTLMGLQSQLPSFTLEEDEMRFYAMQIFLALEHIHRCGIVYRDLKPENILLDEHSGHMKLVDFGLSKELESEDDTERKVRRSVLGTPEYMAPEMVLSSQTKEGYTESVDWWAFGCILHEMLDGESPFTADTPKKILKKILIGKRDQPFQKDVSGAAASLIDSLLNGDVEKRPTPRQIKDHPFFDGFDWNKAARRQYECPVISNGRMKKYVSRFEPIPCHEHLMRPVVSPGLISHDAQDASATAITGGGGNQGRGGEKDSVVAPSTTAGTNRSPLYAEALDLLGRFIALLSKPYDDEDRSLWESVVDRDGFTFYLPKSVDRTMDKSQTGTGKNLPPNTTVAEAAAEVAAETAAESMAAIVDAVAAEADKDGVVMRTSTESITSVTSEAGPESVDKGDPEEGLRTECEVVLVGLESLLEELKRGGCVGRYSGEVGYVVSESDVIYIPGAGAGAGAGEGEGEGEGVNVKSGSSEGMVMELELAFSGSLFSNAAPVRSTFVSRMGFKRRVSRQNESEGGKGPLVICQLLQTYDAKAFRKQLAKYPMATMAVTGAQGVEEEMESKQEGGNSLVGLADFELRGVMGSYADDNDANVQLWSAVSVRSHRPFVLKLFDMGIVDKDEGYLARVVREQNILRQLDSSFVSKLVGSFSTSSHQCLVFDRYGLAGDLVHVQQQQPDGVFGLDSMRHIVAELILALTHVHARGFTHRDLKPSGVLMGSDGRVCLTDFNLAQTVTDDCVEQASGSVAHFEYLAPEILQESLCTTAADYWALGCLAFEMRNGYSPFGKNWPGAAGQRGGEEEANDVGMSIMSNERHPPRIDDEAEDATYLGWLNALLIIDLDARLGDETIRLDPFFEGLDWDAVEAQTSIPPYVPNSPAPLYHGPGDDRCNSSPGWELEKSRRFCSYWTKRCTNIEFWRCLIADPHLFVLRCPTMASGCEPRYLTPCALSAGARRQSTGLADMVADLDVASTRDAPRVQLELVPQDFHVSKSKDRALAALDITVVGSNDKGEGEKDRVLRGAAKFLFSLDRKLAGVELCFDAHEFAEDVKRAALNSDGSQQLSYEQARNRMKEFREFGPSLETNVRRHPSMVAEGGGDDRSDGSEGEDSGSESPNRRRSGSWRDRRASRGSRDRRSPRNSGDSMESDGSHGSGAGEIRRKRSIAMMALPSPIAEGGPRAHFSPGSTSSPDASLTFEQTLAPTGEGHSPNLDPRDLAETMDLKMPEGIAGSEADGFKRPGD